MALFSFLTQQTKSLYLAWTLRCILYVCTQIFMSNKFTGFRLCYLCFHGKINVTITAMWSRRIIKTREDIFHHFLFYFIIIMKLDLPWVFIFIYQYTLKPRGFLLVHFCQRAIFLHHLLSNQNLSFVNSQYYQERKTGLFLSISISLSLVWTTPVTSAEAHHVFVDQNVKFLFLTIICSFY